MTDIPIDPEKVEAALAYFERDAILNSWQFDTLRDAARAHLATLPRYKEVEIAVWKVVDSYGNHGTDCTQEEAERIARMTGCRAVRLTGTAKVKVTP